MGRACDDPRLLDSLRHNCGPLIMGALENPDVIEIMLNPDGSLWMSDAGRIMSISAIFPRLRGG
jgi:type IV secretion system protein VirB11